MDDARLQEILRQTLSDKRLSRGEQQALRAVLADEAPDDRMLDHIRARAFHIAAEEMTDAASRLALHWLEELIRILEGFRSGAGEPPLAEARFGPGKGIRERVKGLLVGARKSVDICVFSITDDRIANAILKAHERGVAVRIVTDDEKTSDAGSDVARLARAGIPVATDASAHHMHHKFAPFDDRVLVTGSYNWTRSAADENRENIVVTSDPRLLAAYREEFDRLWAEFR